MSYDEKKYLEDRKKTWKKFIDLSIKGTIVIAIILILMAIFLTNSQFNYKLYLDILNKRIEFNIKKIRKTHIQVKRLKKYNLVEPNMNKNHQRKQLNSEDHVIQFDTYDGKIIIISSPYYKCDNHIEYGYTLYDKPLYNKSCYTYYIIID